MANEIQLNLIFLLLITLGYCAVTIKDLPSYFPKCKRNEPQLNDCILKATETMRPYLKKGIPELNIPPISPFTIPEISLHLGTQSLQYNSTLKNVVLTGMDTYKFHKFNYDAETMQFDAALEMGNIDLSSDYIVKGRILAIPIQGKGKFEATIFNSNGTLKQIVKFVEKKGLKYFEPVETVVKINIGRTETKQISGLFGENNEELGKAFVKAINDNNDALVEELKPAVEEVITRIIVDITLKSIYKVPYDKLYPQ